MKKLLLPAIVAMALLSSCGNSGETPKKDSVTNATAAVKYQCPMKCEGEKTYDKPGKCPVCQMDMKEVK